MSICEIIQLKTMIFLYSQFFVIENSTSLFDEANSVYKRKQFYTYSLSVISPVPVNIKKTFYSCDDREDLNVVSSFGYYIPYNRLLKNFYQKYLKIV